MNHGGRREGAGCPGVARKPAPIKKKSISITVSTWVLQMLKKQGGSRSAIFESAVIDKYNLKQD